MDGLTDLIVTQMLGSLDPTPVNPSQEQKYLAFLICKNLTDLGETGLSILNYMNESGISTQGLPEKSTIGLCQSIIQKFYSDNMFIEDEDGFRPNWDAVNGYDTTKTQTSYRIYRAIKNNVVDKPESKDIQKAVDERNKKFFVANFDKIFADIPFKQGLTEFKNFLNSPHVTQEHQNIVWAFFETLLDLFLDEEEILKDLQDM